MGEYVPLSVREGGRKARLRWWLGSVREAVALRLAPWLRGDRAQELARIEERLAAHESALRVLPALANQLDRAHERTEVQRATEREAQSRSKMGTSERTTGGSEGAD
jgi:hypothetical protein